MHALKGQLPITYRLVIWSLEIKYSEIKYNYQFQWDFKYQFN